MTIPNAFLSYAADILADTDRGVTGSVAVGKTIAYAARDGINLPHLSVSSAPNKRTALFENLSALPPESQFRVILELCDREEVTHPDVRSLKIQLLTKYRDLNDEGSSPEADVRLIEETRHWLQDFPTAMKLYEEALLKIAHKEFHRNALDDLRSAIEQLLKELLGNDKSLEKQLAEVGSRLKQAGGSPELSNMFHKLLDYYGSYQNTYVKHNDAVNQLEVEFIFELTSTFMKHLVRSLAH